MLFKILMSKIIYVFVLINHIVLVKIKNKQQIDFYSNDSQSRYY